MGKFKKGHKLGFKHGHVPQNKKRQCVPQGKNDKVPQTYVRLTREMTKLVQNVPYKEDTSSSQPVRQPATLLRPQPVRSKMDKKTHSLSEKQR